jgi:uncharacterized membrane protein YfcA
MKNPFFKIILFSFIPGIVTGLTLIGLSLILGIITNYYFTIPFIAIGSTQFLIVITSMILSALRFKEKYPDEFNLKTTAGLSFSVFVITLGVLILRRVLDGHIVKYPWAESLLYLCIVLVAGSCISFLIAWKMSSTENK